VFFKDLPAGVARARQGRLRGVHERAIELPLPASLRASARGGAGLQHDERRWFTRIADWLGTTTSGDRAEIDDLPDDLPLWSELTATSEQCLGRECPHFADCFITKMREACRRRADRDRQSPFAVRRRGGAAGSVRRGDPGARSRGDRRGHQLEDVVTQYFGVSLSTYRIDEFARDAAHALGRVPANDGAFAVSVSEALSDVQMAARRLFDIARSTPGAAAAATARR
jgi:ATP-dependent DNA helicase DinG